MAMQETIFSLHHNPCLFQEYNDKLITTLLLDKENKPKLITTTAVDQSD